MYWLNEMYIMTKKFDMEKKTIDSGDGRVTELSLPSDWNKQHIKTYCDGMRGRQISDEIKNQVTLPWIGPIHQDHEYDSRSQSWWLKGKIGSILTKTRDNPSGPLCAEENEDITHFLECKEYPGNIITEIIETDIQHRHIWSWIFHFDRQHDIRVKVSQWIHNRWKT